MGTILPVFLLDMIVQRYSFAWKGRCEDTEVSAWGSAPGQRPEDAFDQATRTVEPMLRNMLNLLL